MEYLAVKISTVELPVSFEVREKYLLVIGRGKRETFKEMVMASEMVYAKTIETKPRFLLVDYRDLEVNLNMSEAVNMVKRSEAVQPEFKNLTGAIVVGPSALEFGHFWKHLATQRGFKVQMFEEFEKAEKWLLEQIQNVE